MVDVRTSEGDEVSRLTARALELKPAPAPLDVVQQLLNTRNRLVGYDLLEDRGNAASWLSLVSAEAVGGVDDAAVRRLRSLREALRDLLLAQTAGATPSPDVVERLRTAAGSAAVRVDFDASGSPVLAAPAGIDVVEQVESRVLGALAASDPDARRRLKACLNPDCGWVFYDGSRSRSGTWCLMNVCGSRHKMAQYRNRQHQGRQAGAARRQPDAKGNDATNSQGPPT